MIERCHGGYRTFDRVGLDGSEANESIGENSPVVVEIQRVEEATSESIADELE